MSRKPVPCIPCARCKKAYKPTPRQREAYEDGRAVYCSRDCQKGANLVTLSCDACGADVIRRRSEVPESGRVFCDGDCRNAGAARVRSGETKPCAICGVEMYVKPALAGTKKTCSDACRQVYARREQVTRECDRCRTPYTRSASQAGRFCTKKCADEQATIDGQGYMNADGYMVKSHKGRPRLVHRLMAEETLGRALLRSEEVHHVNGVRHDNRVDGPFVIDERGRMRSGNLEIWSHSHPAGQEVGAKLDHALEQLALYVEALRPDQAAALFALAERLTTSTPGR